MSDSYFRHEEERHCEQRAERLFLVLVLLLAAVLIGAAFAVGGLF